MCTVNLLSGKYDIIALKEYYKTQFHLINM